MAKAIASPEEIRRFAHALLQHVNRLRDAQGKIRGQFDDLHDHWRDTKYERFRDIFTHSMSHLGTFLQRTEAYSQFLHRKAEKLEEYLRHRY